MSDPTTPRQYGGSTADPPPPGPWSPNTLAELSPFQREADFQKWYADMAADKFHKTGFRLNPNPDDPGHFYDHRALYRDIMAQKAAGGAASSDNGHSDSSYKLPGHPRTYLVDPKTGKAFDTRTMQYVGGGQVPEDRANMDIPDMKPGFDPESAKKLAGIKLMFGR